MTLVMIIVLGIINRNARGCGKMYLLEKVVLHIIAALGASVAFLDMIILLRDARNANSTPYHEGLFRGTQFLMWVTVLLVSKFGNWFGTFCNRILCFWWIMKQFLAIPFLRTAFSSHELLLEGCRHSSKDMGRTIWIMLRPRLCIQYTSTTKLP